MSEELKQMLRSFNVSYCEMETNVELFTNKTFANLTQLNVIWINVNNNICRAWLAANLDKSDVFALITVYKSKSSFNEWVSQLEALVDNVISKTTLKDIKALSITELIQKCLEIYKLKKPKSLCKKIVKFFLSKIGI